MSESDDLSDLIVPERPLPDPIDISQAWPARRCECGDRAVVEDDSCVRCGYLLTAGALDVPEAA